MFRKPVIVALGTLLVVSLAPPPAAGTPDTVPVVEPSKPDVVKPVTGRNAPAVETVTRPMPEAGPAAVGWPAAGSADVTLPGLTGGSARGALSAEAQAGDLPVWVERRAGGPSKVAVRLSRRDADGLSVSVRRTDGAVVRGPVGLTVDYSGFRDAFGGDWASRLRLVGGVENQRNDVGSGKLSGEVSVDGSENEFVVAAAPEGSAGDYKATSLSPSGKWQVSTQSGGFSWGYGLQVPPVPGGLVPELSLSYSSQSVDGRTASVNSQPSWVGEGWNLWPGFIERSFKGCADDLGGNNGQTKTGDLCWETENATMSFGEQSGELVLQGGVWHAKDDDGTKIERLTGAANGDQGDGVAGPGEYWKVTGKDGTQYFFGRRTDSAWTVPMFGNDGGEPCNRATFDGSQCEQAYRWNLDYVVDRHGNSMSYFYREESNLYGANKAVRSASYTRGGTLEWVEYGTRDGATGQAPARVWFDVADRCLSNCGVHNAGSWPDVPWDQECTSGTCAGKISPSFWSTKRLSTATTQISTGGGGWRNVDRWTFGHGFPSPGDGTTAGLWLASITRTGLSADPAVSLPPVLFEGTTLQNRVNSAADGLPALNKYRITTIKNESGGAINVGYAAPDCVPGPPPPVDTNTRRCFPVRWAWPPEPEPRDDWFHKYVVTRVVEDDLVGNGKNQVTNYEYAAGGGAWAYDDNPLVDEKKRSWSEWRGYEKVVVRKGDPVNDENKPESWTRHQYFRGMNGDKLKAGGTKPVKIEDSTGTAIDDDAQFAGFERETIVKNGVGGAEVTGELHTPWSRLTASQGSLKAHQVLDVKTESRTRLSDGSYRKGRVDTTFDGYSNPLTVDDTGDLANPNDDRCTTTTYAPNTDLPSTEKTVGVACGRTPSFPADAITDTQTYYDGGGLGEAPSKGDVTMTKIAKDYAGSTPDYLNDKRSTYDTYGRVKESWDALSRKTTTSYVDTNGLNISSTVTNPLNHATTTTLDPARGLPTKVVDANNRTTTMTYDALGRLTAVWKPGRVQGTDSAHVRYAYEVRNNGPSWVRTERLNANQNHVASYTLFDGFLRERQTQAPSPQGGRILTDTLYDSRGLKSVARAPYYHKDALPGTTLFLPDSGAVPNATVQVYDGAERVTDSIYMKLNVEQWRTRTYHGGDRVSVAPPEGGTATTTYKDARGNTTELLQYKTRPVAGPPTGATDRTAYTHTKRGEQASITDPAGNVWRYDYDVLGRKVRADDPDHGVSTMTYDDAGQLLTTTDARSRTITTSYDDLGRKKETKFGSTVLTRHVYDTLSKGALTSSTRFVGGHAYTRNVTGYDTAGLPKGESMVIPANEAGLAGTYPTETTFRADGSPASVKLPRLTSLFADETLVHEYNDLGLPDKVTSGTTTYAAKTIYTALGEPTQVEMGPLEKRVWRTTYREEGTRRVSEVLTEREDPMQKMTNQLTYAYDPVGNITRIGDRTAGSTVDTQCFKYDYLRRVTAAWTATDNCIAAPSPSVIGGPAPYWQQYAYDATGNRKTLTRKGLGGAADQVSSYTYPASGEGADRPHAVSSIQTGPQTDTYGYDAAGNTVSRPGQTLTWNDEGLLESVGTTSYVYDADGKQLIRRDPGSVTLFVGGGEVKLDTATKAETGTRYYEGAGTRTGSDLTWTVADHHGTAQVAINSNTLATTTRRFDLFGNPRATGSSAAAASAWPGGNRGFVGGITNDNTGLTRLGAREYDPALGKFMSVDPIVESGDPQQMNAYAYSNNSPATMTDPTGLKYYVDDEGLVTIGSLAHTSPAAIDRAQRKSARIYQWRKWAKLKKIAEDRRAYLKRLKTAHRAWQHDRESQEGARAARAAKAEAARNAVLAAVLNALEPKNLSDAQAMRDDPLAKSALGVVIDGAKVGDYLLSNSNLGQALIKGSEATGMSYGLCAGGTLAGGVGVMGSLCWQVTPDGDHGFLLSGGGGKAWPSVQGFVGPSVSNAQKFSDLTGLAGTVSGSGGQGLTSFGGSFTFDVNSEGKFIWDLTAGWTPGVRMNMFQVSPAVMGTYTVRVR